MFLELPIYKEALAEDKDALVEYEEALTEEEDALAEEEDALAEEEDALAEDHEALTRLLNWEFLIEDAPSVEAQIIIVLPRHLIVKALLVDYFGTGKPWLKFFFWTAKLAIALSNLCGTFTHFQWFIQILQLTDCFPKLSKGSALTSQNWQNI